MKLTDAIDLIDGTIANCYVVNFRDRVILIDAGMKSSAKRVLRHFEDGHTKPDTVLITHCHTDHIGGLADLDIRYHSQIFVPDKEVEIARGNERMPSKGGLMSAMVGLSKPRPVSNARPLSEFDLAGLEKMDTNGHTPGSTSYYFEELKALFVGDAVSENGGRYEFNKTFTLDPQGAQLSIEKILGVHGTTAYPGHGQPFLIP